MTPAARRRTPLIVLLALGACTFGDTETLEIGSTQSALERVAQEPVRPLAGVPELDSTGQAAYTIPLEVPPGRVGVAPELTLHYSSAAGDGPFGPGFTLTGVGSRVHRCQKTIETDDEVRGIRFDTGDRLCIDGMRLIGPAEDAQYWADGTRFAEEMSAWRRIEWRTAEDSRGQLVVTDRTGRRWIYGGEKSTVVAPRGDRDADGALIDPTEVVVEWKLARVEDAYGNYYELEYLADSFPNGTYEHRLGSIRYTGGAGIEPAREVLLHYGPRPNVEVSYSAGTAQRLSTVVQRIEMLVRGDRVREYELDYKTDEWTGKPIVVGLTECDRNELCRPKTRFDWTSPSWDPSSDYVMESPDGWMDWGGRHGITDLWPQLIETGDLDGDDKDDLIYWAHSGGYRLDIRARLSGSRFEERVIGQHLRTDGFTTPGPFFRPVDVAEGPDLLAVRRRRSGIDTWDLVRVLGGSSTVVQTNIFACEHHGSWASNGPSMVDHDGDGSIDLVIACKPDRDEQRFDWRLATSRPLGPEPAFELSQLGDIRVPNRHVVFDLDGDGRSELFGLPSTTLPDVELDTLVGFAPVGTDAGDRPMVTSDSEVEQFFADLNGDGLVDRITYSEGELQYWPNTGRGFAAPTASYVFDSSWGDALEKFRGGYTRVADMDRDGRDDVVLMMYGTVRTAVLVMRLASSGLVVDEMPSPGWGIDFGDPFYPNVSYGFLWSHVTLLDHDGDGHLGYTQIGARGPTESFIEILEPTISQRPSVIFAVHDGHLNPVFEGADLGDVRLDEPVLLAPPAACGRRGEWRRRGL